MPVTSVAVTPNDCGLEAPFALQVRSQRAKQKRLHRLGPPV